MIDNGLHHFLPIRVSERFHPVFEQSVVVDAVHSRARLFGDEQVTL